MEALLSQIARTTAEAETLENLTRPLLEVLEQISGLESTYLTRVDEVRGVQHVLFSRNAKEMQIPEGLSVSWGDTLCRRALEEKRSYCDDVPAVWGDSEAARALGIRTYVSQPVRHVDGALYGTLCAASHTSVPESMDTHRLLILFARLISHQVERERLMEGLRRSNAELTTQALTDALTGVANRRALIQELTRMLARAEREERRVLVAFIDLDGFKAINDQYGHDVGDQFLIHIASALQLGTRAGDYLARYGGDEFVVASPEEDPEALQQRLAALTVGRFITEGVTLDYAGGSVGVTTSHPGERDAEDLLARADEAMFAVKQQRRGHKRRGEA